MTFVGKILVIVLMVFALFFLALSTVVFTTEVNWKERVTKLNETKKKLEDDLRRAKAEVDTQKANLDGAKAAFEKDDRADKATIKNLREENNTRQAEITKQRIAIEQAQENVLSSNKEAEARIAESNKLREIVQAVQTQANEYKLQKTDLDQQIVLLKRELEVATANNADLRDRVVRLQGGLRKAGLPSDPTVYKLLDLPPDVEGEVLKVDSKNQLIEISIGSDDGLVAGHELDLYRTKPTPEYLGKVRILETDPNQSSARVIGKTIHGKKIERGDHVTTKIKPRS